MNKNNHYSKVDALRSYEVAALHKSTITGGWRTMCSYRFTACVTKVKSLKDVVRRDLKQMGYHPDRIVITNLNVGNTFTINCRKS